jgi:hypothetical protein
VRAGLKICFGLESKAAWSTVLRLWHHEGLPRGIAEHLTTPAQFDEARPLVSSEQVMIPAGPDMDEHDEFLRAHAAAGVDELFVQQITDRLTTRGCRTGENPDEPVVGRCPGG